MRGCQRQSLQFKNEVSVLNTGMAHQIHPQFERDLVFYINDLTNQETVFTKIFEMLPRLNNLSL